MGLLCEEGLEVVGHLYLESPALFTLTFLSISEVYPVFSGSLIALCPVWLRIFVTA